MTRREIDCPLAPDGYYWQGYPLEEGWPVRKIKYVAPCKNWDNGVCRWFDTPTKVSEFLDFIGSKKKGAT